MEFPHTFLSLEHTLEVCYTMKEKGRQGISCTCKGSPGTDHVLPSVAEVMSKHVYVHTHATITGRDIYAFYKDEGVPFFKECFAKEGRKQRFCHYSILKHLLKNILIA